MVLLTNPGALSRFFAADTEGGMKPQICQEGNPKVLRRGAEVWL